MDQAMDVMETDQGAAAGTVAGGGAPATHENARGLVALARHLISHGQPSQALQAVVAAMRCEGGELAVLQTLNRARELYRSKLLADTAADELASLFAECAIAEAQPPIPDSAAQAGPSRPPHHVREGLSTLPVAVNETSILAMSGRQQVMLDAFSDGSSFICLKCGGLVSNLRKDEHLAYWCG